MCAEFLQKETIVYTGAAKSTESLIGDFVVIGRGPGVQRDPRSLESELVPINFERGDRIFFQAQNAYAFNHPDLPERNFVMIQASKILAKWKGPTTPVEKILALK